MTRSTTGGRSREAERDRVVVGIAEMAVSARAADMLTTYSLGSCVGVTIYDQPSGVGGLIHCQLPLARQSPEDAAQRPLRYVDTGLAAMFAAMRELGARLTDVTIKVAGGCTMLDVNDYFRIGERNVTVVRKVLWRHNHIIDAIDVGGTAPRTMRLDVGTGETSITSCGRSYLLQ